MRKCLLICSLVSTLAAGCGGDDASCTVADNGDGTATITCDDGTYETIADVTKVGTRTSMCKDGTE